MNVTNENFDAALAAFKDAINDVTFIAIDLEMTGIHMPKSKPVCDSEVCQLQHLSHQSHQYSDSPELRYYKARAVASEYSIIQFGVSLFTQTPAPATALSCDTHYEVRPFNIYTFPSGDSNTAQSVVLQPSAISFLKQHNLDFNAWMYGGVTYMNGQQEAEALQRIQQLNDSQSAATGTGTSSDSNGHDAPPSVKPTKEPDILFVQQIMAKLKLWTDRHDNLTDTTPNSDKPAHIHHFPSDLNSFQRLLVRSAVHEAYGDKLLIETLRDGDDKKGGNQRRRQPQLIALRMTLEQRQQHNAQQAEQRMQELQRKLGARQVWKLIVESKKPLISHNGLFDVLFLYHTFEGELPHTLSEFQSKWSAMFPLTYDTKHLINQLMDSESRVRADALKQQLELKLTASAFPTDANKFESVADEPITTTTTADAQHTEHAQTLAAAIRFTDSSLGSIYDVFLAEDKAANINQPTASNGAAVMSDVSSEDEMDSSQHDATESDAVAAINRAVAEVTASAASASSGNSATHETCHVHIRYAPKYDRYIDSVYEHEAAYDAYMTGYCFAKLQRELNLPLELTDTIVSESKPMRASDSSIILPSHNVLPLSRSLYAFALQPDTTYKTEVQTAYYITGLTSEMRNDQVANTLVGQSNRQHVWLQRVSDETAVFLVDEDQAETLIPAAKTPSTITVQPYEEFRQEFNARIQRVFGGEDDSTDGVIVDDTAEPQNKRVKIP